MKTDLENYLVYGLAGVHLFRAKRYVSRRAPQLVRRARKLSSAVRAFFTVEVARAAGSAPEPAYFSMSVQLPAALPPMPLRGRWEKKAARCVNPYTPVVPT